MVSEDCHSGAWAAAMSKRKTDQADLEPTATRAEVIDLEFYRITGRRQPSGADLAAIGGMMMRWGFTRSEAIEELWWLGGI
jgi:hypothetical protein